MKSGISVNITVSLGSLALTAAAIGAAVALSLTMTTRKPKSRATPPRGIFGQYVKTDTKEGVEQRAHERMQDLEKRARARAKAYAEGVRERFIRDTASAMRAAYQDYQKRQEKSNE